MKYENLMDMHTHSALSFDGKDSCLALCEAAAEKGAIGMAITDHLDIDDPVLDVSAFCEKQFQATLEAKEAMKGKMAVLQGIELGQGIYRKELSVEMIDRFAYDFILGAVHNLENTEDFYYLEYNEENVGEWLTRYFDAVYALAQWNWFDSLAHLTYPLRYIQGKYGIHVDLTPYMPIIDAIFEKLIYNKKALELNMSSIDCYHGDTMPPKALLQRFHDMGGKYVTVGSDAHSTDRVCFGIGQGFALLQECGYEHYTIFVRREPWLMPIR